MCSFLQLQILRFLLLSFFLSLLFSFFADVSPWELDFEDISCSPSGPLEDSPSDICSSYSAEADTVPAQLLRCPNPWENHCSRIQLHPDPDVCGCVCVVGIDSDVGVDGSASGGEPSDSRRSLSLPSFVFVFFDNFSVSLFLSFSLCLKLAPIPLGMPKTQNKYFSGDLKGKFYLKRSGTPDRHWGEEFSLSLWSRCIHAQA